MSFIADAAKFGLLPGRKSAPRVRIVCTKGAFPYNFSGGAPANYTRWETGMYVRTGAQKTVNMRTVFCNAYASNGEFWALNSPYTLESAIRGSIIYPFSFGGVRSPLVAPGGGLVISDQLSLDMPADSSFELRSGAIVASGDKAVINRFSSYVMASYGSTAVTSQIFDLASMALPGGGASVSGGFAPVCVLGQTERPQNSFVFWGDSITHGSGDTGVGETTYGHVGWAERGLIGVNGYNIPFCNAARVGEATSAFGVFSSRRKVLFQYATDAVFSMGHNDISTGVALATMQANTLAIWATAKAAGCRVHQTTITPKTTSTSGNWTSAGDQTVESGFGANETRGLFNAWILTKVADGTIDGVIDVNAAICDPASPDKFISTGASDYATADGTHPSTQGHILMSAVMNAYATALPVRIAYA